MRQSRQAGFSALEALVALVIIAIALLPLLSLQGSVSRNFVAQRDLREQIAAQRNSLAILRDLNIMETPQGERRLAPHVTMAWSGQPISRIVRSTRQGTGEGEFNVALYRVAITVTFDDRAPYVFEVDQVGWSALQRRTAP